MCNNYKLITQQLRVIPELISVDEQVVDVFSSSDSPFSRDALFAEVMHADPFIPLLLKMKMTEVSLRISCKK
jgi:hypothetical protein